MASRELKVEIIGDASSVNKALASVSKSSSSLGSSLLKMGNLAKLGMVALGVGAAKAGKEMISLASDAAEVDSKLDVTFGKTLPGLTKEIDKFAQATGASRFELREQAADMGALLVPLTATKKGAADMSMQVVQLATDLGSFNNVPVEESLLAIRSGLVGEAEPLRRFGVLLNAAAVETEGVRMGLAKTGKEMTEQDKVQARYSLIMKQTSLAQGDATRTAGSMSNQVKALKNNVRDMATSAGQMLIPFALTAVKSFNKVLGAVDGFVKKLSEAKGFKAKLNIVWTGVKELAQGFISTFDKYFVSGWTTYSGGGMGRTVETFHMGLLRRLQNLDWGDIGQRILDGIVQGMKDATALAQRLATLITTSFNAIPWAEMGAVMAPAFITMVGTAFTLALDPVFWAQHWELALAIAAAAFSPAIGKLAGRLAGLVVSPLKGVGTRMVLAIAEGIETFSPRLAAAFINAVTFAVGAVARGIVGIAKSIDAAIETMWRRVGLLTRELLQSAFALAVISALKNAANAIVGAGGAVIAAVRELGGKIPGPFVAAFNTVRTALSSALTWITTKAKQIAIALLEPFTAIPGPLGRKATQAVDSLFNSLEGGKPKVLKAAQAMSDALAESAGKPGDKKLQQEALKKTQAFIDVLTKAQGPAKTEATKIATQISQGIIAIPDVSNRIAAKVSAMVRAGLDKVKTGSGAGAVGSTAGEYAGKHIGKQIPEGIAEEAGKGGDKVAAATAKTVREAVGAARLAAATNDIGAAAVQKIINDIVGKTPGARAQFNEMWNQMKTDAATKAQEIAGAIKTARGSWAAAFADLMQAGLDAIDAKAAKWQPPSLLKAQRLAEERERAAVIQAVKDAAQAMQQAIADANAAASAVGALEQRGPKEGQTQEEYNKELADAVAAANEKGAAIAAAQKTLDDAEFAKRQSDLAIKAKAETDAHNKEIASKKKHFKDRFNAIDTALKNEEITWETAQKRLLKLFGDYGIALGKRYAGGIKDGLAAVGSAVEELADAIAARINGKGGKGGGGGGAGKARGGPVFKGGRYIVGEQGPEMFVPKQSGTIMTASQTRAFMSSFTRGGGKPPGTTSGKGSPGFDNPIPAPKWAWQPLWDASVTIATSIGKLEEFIDAVNGGSFRANAGLLNGIAQNRSKWNWNALDTWPTVRDMIDMMLPLGQGMSGQEVADYFGLLKKGGILPGDGLYYGHKGEAVIPLDKGSMRAVTVVFNGPVLGTEEQLTRKIIEGIRREQTRGAPSIIRGR